MVSGLTSHLDQYVFNLFKIVRGKALECLKLSLNSEDAFISEIGNPDDFLYADTLGLILIHGQPFKMTFKVHYFADFAKDFVGSSTGTPRSEVDDEAVRDYMREYCNLTAGYVVDVLASNEINTDISIPLITSGFDEVWFSDKIRPNEKRDWWQFNLDGGSFVSTLSIEVKDIEAIGKIKDMPKEKSSDNEIKFL